MSIRRGFIRCVFAAAAVAALSGMLSHAQTLGEPEEFTAIAIKNNNLGSGAGTVLIKVTRWSTEAERSRLLQALKTKGQDKLLDELQGMKSVGTIRTPDSLAYDLRYAHQQPGEDGGSQIVLATDRPIGFWEATNRPRTIQYPFTVIQMQMGRDGTGKGTLSYATKIVARKNVIELEDFATQPIMLTDIRSKKADR
ncbi:MAG TPA: hypothetical protein VFB85_02680 [Vicinamibacterales bacterium]|jgi:hypothetical protein|nr:hypothetical protein [Vicinamibacterales bacterium]